MKCNVRKSIIKTWIIINCNYSLVLQFLLKNQVIQTMFLDSEVLTKWFGVPYKASTHKILTAQLIVFLDIAVAIFNSEMVRYVDTYTNIFFSSKRKRNRNRNCNSNRTKNVWREQLQLWTISTTIFAATTTIFATTRVLTNPTTVPA